MKIFEIQLKISMKVVAEDVQTAMEGVFDALPMEAVQIIEEVDYETRGLAPGEAGVLLTKVEEDPDISDELVDTLTSLAASDGDDKPN